MIRISHELPLMVRVTGRRTMSPFAPLFGQTALLISGGRLRRILRRGRWLLVLLELQFQRLIVRLQLPEVGLKLGKLFPLCQDQVDKFFFAQRFKPFSGHRLTILPNFTPFVQPGE